MELKTEPVLNDAVSEQEVFDEERWDYIKERYAKVLRKGRFEGGKWVCEIGAASEAAKEQERKLAEAAAQTMQVDCTECGTTNNVDFRKLVCRGCGKRGTIPYKQARDDAKKAAAATPHIGQIVTGGRRNRKRKQFITVDVFSATEPPSRKKRKLEIVVVGQRVGETEPHVERYSLPIEHVNPNTQERKLQVLDRIGVLAKVRGLWMTTKSSMSGRTLDLTKEHASISACLIQSLLKNTAV